MVRDESEWSESKAGGGGNSLGNILIMGIKEFRKLYLPLKKCPFFPLLLLSVPFCFKIQLRSLHFVVVFLCYSERTLRYVSVE